MEIKQYWQNNIVAVNLYQNRENITIGENLNDDFFIPNSFLPNEKSFTITKTVAETGSGNSRNSGIGPNGYRSISMNYENRKKKRDVVVARKGPDKITGNLTEEQIRGVVNKNISQIRYCYENELMRKPELSGSVTVKWKINPQGEVIDVSI